MDGWEERRIGWRRDTSAIEAAGKEKEHPAKEEVVQGFCSGRDPPVAQRHMARFDGWWWLLVVVDIYIKRKV
jgi:hypothetical protein